MGRLIVFKVGSSTLMGPDGELDVAFVRSMCEQICELKRRGDRVVLVSSGAAAVGRSLLGFTERPSDIPTLQACAAAGQTTLIERYAEVLAQDGVRCAQVLLTRGDVVDRTGYLNARNTFERLLDLGVLPIVNENDTVSVREFSFGDNDMLGAIVSSLIDADSYVILSDIDGLYTANPDTDPTATLVERVERVDANVIAMAGGAGSSYGTGGMATKIRAARAMLAAGIPMTICRGRGDSALINAADGRGLRTVFECLGEGTHEQARKLWIGLAGVSRGSVRIDTGACRALESEGASLLPVGVTGVEGPFDEGDTVNVLGPDGQLVARGITRYSSYELVRVHGLRLDVIARFVPERADCPVIHRDELLVF